MVLRKRNCACPDRVPLQKFFFENAASHAKISLPVLDAFESSSASILSLRLGFLDKSNLLKIPDCPAVDLKKVLSVTKHCFVFWGQRQANATIEIYKAFQERLTFLNRHMIVKITLLFSISEIYWEYIGLPVNQRFENIDRLPAIYPQRSKYDQVISYNYFHSCMSFPPLVLHPINRKGQDLIRGRALIIQVPFTRILKDLS